jgi:hypothetical protein
MQLYAKNINTCSYLDTVFLLTKNICRKKNLIEAQCFFLSFSSKKLNVFYNFKVKCHRLQFVISRGF